MQIKNKLRRSRVCRRVLERLEVGYFYCSLKVLSSSGTVFWSRKSLLVDGMHLKGVQEKRHRKTLSIRFYRLALFTWAKTGRSRSNLFRNLAIQIGFHGRPIVSIFPRRFFFTREIFE